HVHQVGLSVIQLRVTPLAQPLLQPRLHFRFQRFQRIQDDIKLCLRRKCPRKLKRIKLCSSVGEPPPLMVSMKFNLDTLDDNLWVRLRSFREQSHIEPNDSVDRARRLATTSNPIE